MTTNVWRRRRVFTALLCAPLGVLLSACGGGADEVAVPDSAVSALVAQPAASAQTPTKGLRRRALANDRKGVTAIAVTRDGSAIGVATSDGKVRVMDAVGTSEIRTIKAPGGAGISGLIFSADGRHLVTAGKDTVVQVWSVETGDRLLALRGHAHALRSIAASLDGTVVATGGEETRVMIWDGTSGRLKRILRGHTDFVNTVSVSPDGRLIASGDADARILVWDAATGLLLHSLRGHTNEVNAVAFGADGKLLVSAGEDGKVLLWDTVSGRQLQGLDGARAPVRSLAISGDGGLLAGGARDGSVVLWDMRTRGVLQNLTGSATAVNVVSFTANNKNQLFVGNEESRLLSWNVSREKVR